MAPGTDGRTLTATAIQRRVDDDWQALQASCGHG
jgi:hypothetical protein